MVQADTETAQPEREAARHPFSPAAGLQAAAHQHPVWLLPHAQPLVLDLHSQEAARPPQLKHIANFTAQDIGTLLFTRTALQHWGCHNCISWLDWLGGEASTHLGQCDAPVVAAANGLAERFCRYGRTAGVIPAQVQ